jgi:hypothetical protein
VDLFRPRAVQAVAALALAVFAAPAHASCAALNGTFADESAQKPEGLARSLTEFAPSRERSRLFRSESPPQPQGGFTSSAPRARPKVTRLSNAVRVTYSGGKVTLAYLDAAGKALVQAPISPSPAPWKCVSGRLERHFETTGGLGEQVRTERTEQALFAAPDGDLHLVETVNIVGRTGAAPRRAEMTFKRLAKAEPAGK